MGERGRHREPGGGRQHGRLRAVGDQHAAGAQELARREADDGGGAVVLDGHGLGAPDLEAGGERRERPPHPDRPAERVEQAVAPRVPGRRRGDERGQLRRGHRAPAPAGRLDRRRLPLERPRAGRDEALVPEQPARPELLLPAAPARVGLQRQRGEPRVGVRDAEDAREAGRLLRADVVALEDEHVRPAPRELVRGGDAADPAADDDHVRHPRPPAA